MKGIPSSLRVMNQRLLLERLLRDEVATRAELADRTGMSRPTAGKILDELLRARVIENVAVEVTEDPATQTRLGRPGQPLRLQTNTPRFALVRVGVNHTDVQWAPVAGTNDETPHERFATPKAADTWLQRLRVLVHGHAPKGLWGGVVSVPGVVDEDQGRCLFSPNLPWAKGIDWLAECREIFGKPVCVVQEIRALALGHMRDAPNERDFLLVDSGEGVGAAVVMQGRLFAGASAVVGELGHSPVVGHTRLCGCGARGCLETLLGDGGLHASWSAARVESKSVAQELSSPSPAPWLLDTLTATAQAIAAALNLFGLANVILSGTLATLSPPALSHLERGIRDGALPARFGAVQVQTAKRKRFRGLSAAAVNRLLAAE